MLFEFMRSGVAEGPKWWRKKLCWLGLALWLGIAQTAMAAPNTILVMGDSLSAGYGIKVEKGWVALLVKRLAEQAYEYNVINASVSGETSGGGKVRFTELLRIHKPGIVILELGANDGLRGLPLANLRSNLAAMLQASRAANARVLLAGMQLPPNYGPAYARGFSAVFNELSMQKGVTLVPFFLDGVALDAKLMQADDLHPNELGQPRVLENVWTILRPMLMKR